MLCVIHKSINAMLTHYKAAMCGPESPANLAKAVNVVDKSYWA